MNEQGIHSGNNISWLNLEEIRDARSKFVFLLAPYASGLENGHSRRGFVILMKTKPDPLIIFLVVSIRRA